MATSNVTRTIDLLGKHIDLIETVMGRSVHVSGLVESVVVSLPNQGVSEAIFVAGDTEYRHLDSCQIISIH